MNISAWQKIKVNNIYSGVSCHFAVATLVLQISPFSDYIYYMTITQTLEIPADRRIILEIPPHLPMGKVILTLTTAISTSTMSEAQEIELINRNADRLNAEAMDVLLYQV